MQRSINDALHYRIALPVQYIEKSRLTAKLTQKQEFGPHLAWKGWGREYVAQGSMILAEKLEKLTA
jgi:hypothetical protein